VQLFKVFVSERSVVDLRIQKVIHPSPAT